MDFVTLRTFDNYFNANITLTKLQDSGIECYLKDEFTVTIDPILTNAIGGIKLVVKEQDSEEAIKLLEQFDKEYLDAVKCPNCGEAKFILINKPSAANFLSGILTWLFSSYAVAIEQVYHCESCGYESKRLPDIDEQKE